MSTDYGREMSCTDSLRTGRFVTGTRLVAEACYRRLITPRGMLAGGEEEQNYGLDLTAIVGSANPTSIAASLPGRIRTELSKDERIATVSAAVLPVVSGPETTLQITIACVTTAEGPFTLKLLATAVTVELLGIA